MTEGDLIADPLRDSLAPDLAADVERHGFSPGGEGLIAANADLVRFNAYGIAHFSPTPANGWTLVGAQEGAVVVRGIDGPSGYSAVTFAPAATAQVTVPDPDVEVLYTTSLVPCAFTVTSGPRRWSIDTYRPGAASVAAEYPLALGPGAHSVTVHGAACGVSFNGLVARRPVSRRGRQLQVDDDGHAGRLPGTDLSARIEEAILEQHYALSVFLYGYVGELTLMSGTGAGDYAAALLTRAQLARRDGGRCLIVAPTPIEGTTPAQVRRIATIQAGVARRAGCVYSDVLAHLWSARVAVHAGLLLVDGVHPTAAGYRRMAAALAPSVTGLLRGSA